MTTKIALLIIYNHRYDKNIPRINEIYAGRFSHIYHIIPFYDGNLDNVIPVYDNSYQFQGYISQAYQHLKNQGFTHYVAIADDMLINPALNESNFFNLSGIKQDACFTHSFYDAVNILPRWWHTKDAVRFSVYNNGLEIDSILPSVEQAKDIFAAQGFQTRLIPEWPYGNLHRPIKEFLLRIRRMLWLRLFRRVYFRYPLLGGYSDMIVVPTEVMPRFCQYCGAFAAARLFVEVAIPTAMALCSNKTQAIDSTNFPDSLRLPRDKARDFLPQFNYSYNELVAHFPKNMLYIHPIKLSKWK